MGATFFGARQYCTADDLLPLQCAAWAAVLKTFEAHLKENGASILRLDAEYTREHGDAVTLRFCRDKTTSTLEPYCDAAFGCVGTIAAAPCTDFDGFRETADLRAIEVVEEKSFTEQSVVYLDVQDRVQEEASFNLSFMSFCVFVFSFGAIVFNTDIHTLIVEPLDEMSNMMRIVGQKIKSLAPKPGEKRSQADHMQQSIYKISGLLQMVFGDAGAEVIAKNMKSEGNTVNCIQAGEKVECIFGFCDIREFTATTECLKVDIMKFVNTTAEIVHGVAKLHRGFPNKNVGDAFLMVWRPPKETLEQNAGLPAEERITGPELWEEDTPVPIADHAYMTILESIDQIDNCQALKDLTMYNPAINARDEFKHGYRTKLGFGLHAGWAIEGAIGSNVKVDCSYLGPHMAMAERLETATKLYGVPLLLSEDFVELMSAEKKRVCACEKCCIMLVSHVLQS